MQTALYAEVYLICLLVVGVLLFWMRRSHENSTSGRWLTSVLLCFAANFIANFCFTLFNAGVFGEGAVRTASYAFKTAYFISLAIGVFAWIGYAEAEIKSHTFKNTRSRNLVTFALAVPVAMALTNLQTLNLFYIDENGAYRRAALYHVFMLYLAAASGVCSFRLRRRASQESDPNQCAHLKLASTFPACILAAWLLSFIGEAVPVICVSVMIELLCLYIGNGNQQISLDKLTRVNNRQNLMAFLNYKLQNHQSCLYLMMMDIDYFKRINDGFGHPEGDEALVRVASVLKAACAPYGRRPYIARYGGDEFIIILEGTAEHRDELSAAINNMLHDRYASLPYVLHMSIGSARHEPGMSAEELIAAADAELYRVKKHR